MGDSGEHPRERQEKGKGENGGGEVVYKIVRQSKMENDWAERKGVGSFPWNKGAPPLPREEAS